MPGRYGARVPERLFLFVQMEFPWELGPADGRYLLRGRPGGEPERVVVLSTLGAARRPSRLGGRKPRGEASAEPAPVATARATIVDPVPLSAEIQARSWLAEIDSERECTATAAVLNRVLFAHRIASADPYMHEVSPAQALVIRAGWGEGEQVADGRWLHARELAVPAARAKRRVAALRPQERLAVLLGARGEALLCEELTLRARLDLDRGRLAHAAIELESAYAAALAELNAEEDRADLATRVAELEGLRAGVAQAARDALPIGVPSSGERTSAGSGAAANIDPELPDEQLLRHALERLEAALRARTATGFHRERTGME
jgi:hypothetical protein